MSISPGPAIRTAPDDEPADSARIRLTSIDDIFSAGSDDDDIDAGAGDDTITGGSGRDSISGGGGDDQLRGGSGDDSLTGDAGDDLLEGGSGDDLLRGGAGDDVLSGGSGTDTAVFAGHARDYAISRAGTRWLVEARDGDDGSDLLQSIERLAFADGIIDLDGRNNAPIAADDVVSVTADGAVLLADLLKNDWDFESSTLRLSAVDATGTHGAVALAAGGVRYDAAQAFRALAEGEQATDSFSYTVSDGALTAIGNVQLRITGVNDAPEVGAARYSLDAGTQGHEIGQLVATDPDAGDQITYELTGTVPSSAAGRPLFAIDLFTGALRSTTALPRAAAAEGYTLQVTVTDSHGLNSTAEVTIDVQAPPATPLLAQISTGASGQELWRYDPDIRSFLQVADIYQGPGGSLPQNPVRLGDAVYFSASGFDGITAYGRELYRLDLTTNNVATVADINPGGASSSPADLTILGQDLYFTAQSVSATGSTGRELFRLDGATGDVSLVADLDSRGSSWPYELTVFSGTLYFSADAHDPTAPLGRELYRVDAENDGVELAADLRVGSASGAPSSLTVFDGGLYFSAEVSPSIGQELYKLGADGRAVSLVADLARGSASSYPEVFVDGDILYVSTIDNLYAMPAGSSRPTLIASVDLWGRFTAFDGGLYFPGQAGEGCELYRYNPVTGVVDLAADLSPDEAQRQMLDFGSMPGDLTAASDGLYFSADTYRLLGSNWWDPTITVGRGLYRLSEGGEAEPVRLDREQLLVTGGIRAVDGVAYVGGEITGTWGQRSAVFRIEGDAVEKIALVPQSTVLTQATGVLDVGGNTYVWAGDGLSALASLQRLDDNGAVKLYEGLPATWQQVYGNSLYFTTTDAHSIRRLDGLTGEITVVDEAGWSNLSDHWHTEWQQNQISDPIAAGSTVLFWENHTVGYPYYSTYFDLRVLDLETGTTTYTGVEAQSEYAGIWLSQCGNASLGGDAYAAMFGYDWYNWENPYSTTICRVDGETQAVSTVTLQGVRIDDFSRSALIGQTLFFAGSVNNAGVGLYKAEIDSSSYAFVADLSAEEGLPQALVSAGSRVFFVSAGDGGAETGRELYFHDASSNETRLAADLAVGHASCDPQDLVAIGDDLFFTANAGDGVTSTGRELFRFDAETSSVTLVADLRPGAASSDPSEITSYHDRIFFTADDGEHGRQLMAYDPVVREVRVIDAGEGSGSGDLHILGVSSDTLWVRALDAAGEPVLWAYQEGSFQRVDIDQTPWNYDVGGLWIV